MSEDFDLILSDLNIPILNGIELVEQLKKIKQDSNIYISSGGINFDERKKILSTGISGIIDKPFSIDIIKSLLK